MRIEVRVISLRADPAILVPLPASFFKRASSSAVDLRDAKPIDLVRARLVGVHALNPMRKRKKWHHEFDSIRNIYLESV